MGAHTAVAAEQMPAWKVGVGAAETEPAAQAGPLDLAAAEDRVLVAAFLAGSQDAFRVIMTRHQRTVYQVCFRFVRNHEDASDLAQDVFVRAFKGLKNFKGDSALSTWLYRVGVNCCLNRIAARRPDTEPLLESRHVDTRSDDPFRAVARSEKATEVRRAIAQLPPRQRATLLLRVYQELSHEEIARILGGSVGATKANFFHALGNLKRLLQS